MAGKEYRISTVLWKYCVTGVPCYVSAVLRRLRVTAVPLRKYRFAKVTCYGSYRSAMLRRLRVTEVTRYRSAVLRRLHVTEVTCYGSYVLRKCRYESTITKVPCREGYMLRKLRVTGFFCYGSAVLRRLRVVKVTCYRSSVLRKYRYESTVLWRLHKLRVTGVPLRRLRAKKHQQWWTNRGHLAERLVFIGPAHLTVCISSLYTSWFTITWITYSIMFLEIYIT